jgi:hypothetical protein
MSACVKCGRDEELRGGFCWDCADAGEARAAARTVRQHLGAAVGNLLRGRWFNLKCDLRWAWGRLTKTGDYTPGGYFDREQVRRESLG